ncbi:MAG: MFS transporter [Rhizobiales bacterium]|nr:MFS transporter [Hyphomicrobiales bacterium]
MDDRTKIIPAQSADAPPVLAPAAAQHGLDQPTINRIVIGLMVAMFLSALDQTIVATALPAIGHELSDIRNLSWVVTAYLLAATTVTPLYGKLSDIHGRRTMVLIGVGVFMLGSVACALSPSMPVLIVSRALQGLGGGGLIALAQTVLADLVSPRERARYQAHFGVVFASASLAGPFLGGVLSEHLHWSVIFWINLPIGVAALAMTARALKLLPPLHRPHRLDVLGAALMACATVTLLLALSWGGKVYPWASAQVLALVGASIAFWGAFAVRLMRAAEPFLPLSVLGNPVVRDGALATALSMGTMVGLSIYVPVYLQAVVGLSASASGLALIPLMGGTVTGATFSGRIMPRLTHYKRVPYVGLAGSIVALAAMSFATTTIPLPITLVLLAMTGVGIGTTFPVTTVSVQNAVRPFELGTTTAALNFFRQLGGALIVAIFGAIMLQGVGVSGGEDGGDLLARAGARPELRHAFAWLFGAGVVGLMLSYFFLIRMEERPLRDRPLSEMPAD